MLTIAREAAGIAAGPILAILAGLAIGAAARPWLFGSNPPDDGGIRCVEVDYHDGSGVFRCTGRPIGCLAFTEGPAGLVDVPRLCPARPAWRYRAGAP